jgi:hypothetical protein
MKTVTFHGPVAVIGDIHGRLDLLEKLLLRLPKNILILVTGDICDRGPDSRGVIDLLIARRHRALHQRLRTACPGHGDRKEELWRLRQ